jgi:catechol 2,3-dioxygenase-like lactoylglutathione lyase family enzyme
MQNYRFSPLTPELMVSDLAASLRFWCEGLGFRVVYDSPEHGFAYLDRGDLQIMLEQYGADERWLIAPMEKPFGRGINFKLLVDSIAPLLKLLANLDWPLFRQPSDEWYRTGDVESGNRQFLVQDPDGYMLRFSQDLGTRALHGDGPGK